MPAPSAPETFETARLVANRLRAEHLEQMCALHQDPRVMATLGGLRDEDTTQRMMDRWLEHWEQYGFGFWMFHDRSTGAFAGRGHLQHVHVGGGPEVELGYALLPEYWGRGLATEMSAALLEIAFDTLGLKDLVCFTMTTNSASRRVMEKVGFTYERDVTHANLPHVFFRLRRVDWAAAR